MAEKKARAKTKEELSRDINEILGMDIKWESPTKEDLIRIHQMFSDPESLATNLLKKKHGFGDGRLLTQAVNKFLGD